MITAEDRVKLRRYLAHNEEIGVSRRKVIALLDALDAAESQELPALRAWNALARVEALAERWENATELGSGEPSVITRAFAAEVRAALTGEDATR